MRNAYLLLREGVTGQPILLIIWKGVIWAIGILLPSRPGRRNQDIFAGADLDLGGQKKAPRSDKQLRSKLGSRR